jgi:hypothetical protein
MPRWDTGEGVSFTLYRPFNAVLPTASGVAGTLFDRIHAGRSPGGSNLLWSHVLEVGSATPEIIDNCSRTGGGNAILYSDGDEIRITRQGGGKIEKFVVVWVERTSASQTCFLLRDSYYAP